MKQRRYTLDLPLTNVRPPQAGDLLCTARTVNRVTDSRPVESRIWPNRWKITAVRVAERSIEERAASRYPSVPDGAHCFVSQPYRRGEGPIDVFGDPGR